MVEEHPAHAFVREYSGTFIRHTLTLGLGSDSALGRHLGLALYPVLACLGRLCREEIPLPTDHILLWLCHSAKTLVSVPDSPSGLV